MSTMTLLMKKQVIMDHVSLMSVESHVSTHSLSDVTSDSDALNVDNDIVGEKSSHHGPVSSDEGGVARKYSLSDVTSDSDALNVDNNIVGEKSSHHGPVASDERGVTCKYSLTELRHK